MFTPALIQEVQAQIDQANAAAYDCMGSCAGDVVSRGCGAEKPPDQSRVHGGEPAQPLQARRGWQRGAGPWRRDFAGGVQPQKGV